VVCLGDFGLAIHNGSQTSPRLSPVSTNFPQLSSSGSDILPTFALPSCSIPVPVENPFISSLGRSWEAKKHTSAVGTLTYSSPEQRCKGVYNEKTDIFSLGIIFFELYYTSSTKMEKARVLSDLRNRILPPVFLQKYPTESAFILWLMSPNPEDRPSVDQILAHDLLVDEFITVQRKDIVSMERAMQKQNAIILDQQEHILMLERKLAAMCGISSQELPSRDPSLKMMQIV